MHTLSELLGTLRRRSGISQYELANRLSYLLWETMPDDELFEAADLGQLETEAQIEAQARRMLEDDRARAAVRNFARQWLYLDRVVGEDKLPGQFQVNLAVYLPVTEQHL